jgi:hypothetical protein
LRSVIRNVVQRAPEKIGWMVWPSAQWWPPIPEPDPPPERLVDYPFGFAMRLAAATGEHEGTQLGEALDRAVERSVAVLESLADTMAEGRT